MNTLLLNINKIRQNWTFSFVQCHLEKFNILTTPTAGFDFVVVRKIIIINIYIILINDKNQS